MGTYLDLFESELYSFERLAPFVLAVQKFKPEIISALRDMQNSLISAIDNNEKELSSLYKNDTYELSLHLIDFMKDNRNDYFLIDSNKLNNYKINLDIINLEENLQSPNLSNEEREKIIRRIEKAEKDQDEYIPKQKEKLEKLTCKIKEKNKDLLKLPIPHPFMLSDLIHEYDFVKIIAWYYFLIDKRQFAKKLQSSQTSHQEKFEIIKKNHFFFTRMLKDYDGNTIDSQSLIVPDDVFFHRKIQSETRIYSEAIGKLERCEEGYIMNISSTIITSDDLQINDQELIKSVRRAIHKLALVNYQMIGKENEFNIDETFKKIDSIKQDQKEKYDKRFKGRIMGIINGYAIIKIATDKITVASSIKILEKELQDRFNQAQRCNYEKAASIYKSIVDEVNDYESSLETWTIKSLESR